MYMPNIITEVITTFVLQSGMIPFALLFSLYGVTNFFFHHYYSFSLIIENVLLLLEQSLKFNETFTLLLRNYNGKMIAYAYCFVKESIVKSQLNTYLLP